MPMFSSLAEEVREGLVTLPYYGVFDWLESEVRPNGVVILKGQVVTAAMKSDAEVRSRRIRGVDKVINNVEVLPVSSKDEQLRLAVHLAIYKWTSPLFRYATRAMPPIHIIVKNGQVTLKGSVATDADKESAVWLASSVPSVTGVIDELKLEPPVD